MRSRLLIALISALLIALFSANVAMADPPPIVPFDDTGDLYVLDNGCLCVLRITPDGKVSVDITEDEILAVTGASEIELEDNGIAFDPDGSMYFTIDAFDGFGGNADAILKKSGGVLSVLTTSADIEAVNGGGEADPEGLTYGDDGFLYVVDEFGSDSVLQVDPVTGAVSVYVDEAAFNALAGITDAHPNAAIVAAPGGTIFVATDDLDADPNAIFEIAPGGVPSVLTSDPIFSDLDVFMTRAPNGDLIISDNSSADTIHRVTTAGAVSTFLSENELEDADCADGDVDLEGGIAFDDDGNFYLAEQNTGIIFKFDSLDSSTGAVDTSACSEFVTDFTIFAVTFEFTDFDAGIAFAPFTGDNGRELVSVSPFDDFDDDVLLRTIDESTGETIAAIRLDLPGEVIVGGNGLAVDPTTGTLWGILRLDGQSGRELVTIDPDTGLVTSVGDTGDRFAGITFDDAGTLYGVTGDGAFNPETLFTLDKTDGAPTELLPLGNGDDGETIAFNPNDGLIYHASGIDSGRIFETIDPNTLDITDIPLTGDEYIEATALVFSGSSFLLGDLIEDLLHVSDDGEVTFIGIMDHTSKGLAFVGEDALAEVDVTDDLVVIDLDNPPPGVTAPGGIFPITATFSNAGAKIFDEIRFVVTVAEYLDGSAPGPELANRDAGSPAGVGAELTIPLPGGMLGTGETIEVLFEALLPIISPFQTAVDAFSFR